jgi:hypothetical protein
MSRTMKNLGYTCVGRKEGDRSDPRVRGNEQRGQDYPQALILKNHSCENFETCIRSCKWCYIGYMRRKYYFFK